MVVYMYYDAPAHSSCNTLSLLLNSCAGSADSPHGGS